MTRDARYPPLHSMEVAADAKVGGSSNVVGLNLTPAMPLEATSPSLCASS